MKKFTGNLELQNKQRQYILQAIQSDQKLAAFMAGMPETMNDMEHFFSDLMEKSHEGRNPGNTASDKIYQHIISLRSFIESLKSSLNPQNEKNENIRDNIVNGFNSFNSHIYEDIAEFMNEAGYDKMEDPNISTLFSFANICVGIESAEKKMIIKQEMKFAKEAHDDFNRQYNLYLAERNSIMETMGEHTALEIEGMINAAKKEKIRADEKLNTLESDEYKNSIKSGREQAEKLKRLKLQEIEDEKKELKRKKELLEQIKTNGNYSLDRLLSEEGRKELNNYDERMAGLSEENRKLDEEQNLLKTGKTDLESKEKELKKQQEEFTDYLKSLNVEDYFNMYHDAADKESYILRSLELIEELKFHEADLMPALVFKGIISMSGNDKDKNDSSKTIPEEQWNATHDKHKRLADMYVELKDCLEKTMDDPGEVREFFDKLEHGTSRFKPMDSIKNEYGGIIPAIFETNIIRKKEAGNHYPKEADFYEIEEKYAVVLAKETEINNLKSKLSQLKTPKEIKAAKEKNDKLIAEIRAEKIEKINNYRDNFGLEPLDNDISTEELIRSGEKAYREAASDVEFYKSAHNAMNKIHEIHDLDRQIDDFSEEKYKNDLREQKEISKRCATFISLKEPVIAKYNALPEKYSQLQDLQERLKTSREEMVPVDRFSHALESITALNAHILDAKRIVGHTNTDFFNNMKSAMQNVVDVFGNHSSTDAQKFSSITHLRDMSQVYLNEKLAQKHLFQSDMRIARMNYARQLISITKSVIEMNEQITTDPDVRAVEALKTEQPLKSYRGVNEYYDEFRQEHQNKMIANKRQRREELDIRARSTVSQHDAPEIGALNNSQIL